MGRQLNNDIIIIASYGFFRDIWSFNDELLLVLIIIIKGGPAQAHLLCDRLPIP